MDTDVLQSVGVLLALVGAASTWGAMKQKVKDLKEDQKKFLLKEAFDPFAEECLRRLRRIEEKQDAQNGRSQD